MKREKNSRLHKTLELGDRARCDGRMGLKYPHDSIPMVHVQHVQLRAHAQAIRGLQKGLRRERELVSTGHFKTSEQLHINE